MNRTRADRSSDKRTTPKKPVILLIRSDATTRELDRLQLEETFGDHFEIETILSAGAADALVTELREEGRELALVIISDIEEESVREQLLSRVKAAAPAARTLLLSENTSHDRTCADEIASSATQDGALANLAKDLLSQSGDDDDNAVEVIGDQWSSRSHEVKDLLCRHRVPYRWIDVEGDRRTSRRGEVDALEVSQLPMLVFPDGTELADPSDAEISEKLGFETEAANDFYDVVIVGGGPAGLAAAVYAASEGLRTIVIERRTPGGQAGASALIENYLGFPEGVSGAELADRAVQQAERFGSEMLVSHHATKLRDENSYRVIELDDGAEVASHTVLITTGVHYKELTVPGADRLWGKGIYYGAARAEAARYTDQEICLLGGGNSAAQAAMLLARHARRLRMIMFEDEMGQTMSRYLVARMQSTPNIEIVPSSTVVEVLGDEKLEAVIVEQVKTKERHRIDTSGLFVFIGASPHTDWLGGVLETDDDGFIVTGRDLTRQSGLEKWPLDRYPMHLETSMPGVFAAGDVRHASVKRIGSAVGEGAMAVQFVHQYLKER